MKAAWTNLSATGQANVNSQMTTSITAFDSLASKINDFLGQVGPLFNVRVDLFRKVPFSIKPFWE